MIDLCAYDGSPCWIMGTGFRIVTADCAIDDATLDKFTGPTLAETTHFTGGTLAQAVAADFTAPAAVPLPASGVLLALALAALIARGKA